MPPLDRNCHSTPGFCGLNLKKTTSLIFHAGV
jgi:hypothetical protein